MTPYPAIGFYIGGFGEIRPDSPLWHLPLSEKVFDHPRRKKKPAGNCPPPITIGDYFLAARRFLFHDGCLALARAFNDQTGQPLFSYPHPVILSLSLEKHGLFYHPVKLMVKKHGHPGCALVLNGAVSGAGLALVEKEYRLLSQILNRIPLPVFPKVYGVWTENSKKGDLGFFMGEWFEGFCEFHSSMKNGRRSVAVWGEKGEIRFFSLDEAAVIYERIAFVLTTAYNLETFEQIFPWHHAAGDFIVNPDLVLNPGRKGLGVRLITVRGYGVLAEFESDDDNREGKILAGLLVFFLNLSIRMQLDKVDGIGETVFLGETVLKATLAGFLDGLDAKAASGGADLRQAFMGFAQDFTLNQLTMIFENILSPVNNEARERAVVRENLTAHCRSLYTLLKTDGLQDFY